MDIPLPDRARDAIRQTFGRRRLDAVEPIGGGLSGSGAFRLELDGRRYLLKIERPADGFNDPARQFACLAPAAEAGLAPRLRFADPASGVAISDFLESRPLDEHPGGRAGLLAAMGDLIRRLQALAPFPPLVEFPLGVGLLLARAAASGGLAADQHAQAIARLDDLVRRLDWGGGGLVASHNDLNPRNILFDGERLWLVDWETAFLNDPFTDPAILANFFARDPAETEVLTSAWLGRAPTADERERLGWVRQLCRLYYAALLIASAHVELQAAGQASAEGPDLETAQGRLAYGLRILGETSD